MAPLLLVTLALALGLVVTPLLERASWPSTAPGLGLLAWTAVATSAVLSLVFAGVALALPALPVSEGLAAFFHACSNALREHYATPGGAMLAVGGGVVALLLVTRLLCVHIAASRSRRGVRARHRDLVRLVGRQLRPGVMVVDFTTPAAYCIPGRRGCVIISEGALETLTRPELEQVLSHETAHLVHGHHRLIALAETLAAATFGLLGTGAARDAIVELAEMHADDSVDQHLRQDLASAVLKLAGAALRPAGVLNIAGGATVTRLQRLRSDAAAAPMSGPRGLGLLALCSVTLVLPLMLALLPAFDAIGQQYCPLVS